ncbi:MAG TPA: hypothetical protein VH414_13315 [Lichenihabitans sp.]|jgi:hypothetical protein|nr:hypothetical protein [Lichenihabitans sp.]
MRSSIIAMLATVALLTTQAAVRAQDYDDGRGPDPGAAVGAAIVGGVLGGLLGAVASRQHHHEVRIDRLARPPARGSAAFGGRARKGPGAPAARMGQGGARMGQGGARPGRGGVPSVQYGVRPAAPSQLPISRQ